MFNEKNVNFECNETAKIDGLGKQLASFLAAFYPDLNEPIHLIQFKPKQAPPFKETYVDSKGKERHKEPPFHLPRTYSVTRRRLETNQNEIQTLVANGLTRGSYFYVNSGGTTKGEIDRLNAWFCESDTLSIDEQLENLKNSPLPPSIVVVTKKSVHAYWLAEGACNEIEWINIQKRLQAQFDGDKSLVNVNRMMRLPYFDHITYVGQNAYTGEESDAQLFLIDEPDKTRDYERKAVELKEIHQDRRYTLQQMQNAFADVFEPEKEKFNYVSSGEFPHWIDELRAYFYDKGTRTKNGYELSCPSCGDVSKSTGFVYKDGGFKCHKSCCTPREMAQAIGIEIDSYEQKTNFMNTNDFADSHQTNNSGESNTKKEQFEDATKQNKFPIGMLWGDFERQEFPYSEPVLCGIRRRQIGMLNAVTNVGKTMWTLNQCLMMAAGGINTPFVNEPKESRVMFIDSESSKFELQDVINKMTRDWSESEKEKVRNNLLLLCEDDLNGEILTLSKASHIQQVEKSAISFKPDLIVVDTLSATFELKSENDNAEIARVVMKPLKRLALNANAAILVTHHIGKMNEDSNTSAKAYSGRGGSALGGNSRTVMNLTRDKNDETRVVFSMPKMKGRAAKDTVMRWCPDTLWFTVTDEQPPVFDSSYKKVVDLVTKEMKTAEIVQLSQSTLNLKRRRVEDILTDAVKRNDLRHDGRGIYAPKYSANSAASVVSADSAETTNDSFDGDMGIKE